MANLNSNTKDYRHGGADVNHTPPSASRHLLYLRGGVFAAIILAIGLASCNVTRTITTTAQTVQRGDTTTIIQTKTIEQYDGSLTDPRLR